VGVLLTTFAHTRTLVSQTTLVKRQLNRTPQGETADIITNKPFATGDFVWNLQVQAMRHDAAHPRKVSEQSEWDVILSWQRPQDRARLRCKKKDDMDSNSTAFLFRQPWALAARWLWKVRTSVALSQKRAMLLVLSHFGRLMEPSQTSCHQNCIPNSYLRPLSTSPSLLSLVWFAVSTSHTGDSNWTETTVRTPLSPSNHTRGDSWAFLGPAHIEGASNFLLLFTAVSTGSTGLDLRAWI